MALHLTFSSEYLMWCLYLWSQRIVEHTARLQCLLYCWIAIRCEGMRNFVAKYLGNKYNIWHLTTYARSSMLMASHSSGLSASHTQGVPLCW